MIQNSHFFLYFLVYTRVSMSQFRMVASIKLGIDIPCLQYAHYCYLPTSIYIYIVDEKSISLLFIHRRKRQWRLYILLFTIYVIKKKNLHIFAIKGLFFQLGKKISEGHKKKRSKKLIPHEIKFEGVASDTRPITTHCYIYAFILQSGYLVCACCIRQTNIFLY